LLDPQETNTQEETNSLFSLENSFFLRLHSSTSEATKRQPLKNCCLCLYFASLFLSHSIFDCHPPNIHRPNSSSILIIMGGATSRFQETNWETSNGQLESVADTIDACPPTEKYNVYDLIKRGVNQRDFDILDSQQNLLYTTRAVPGTLAWFDVLGPKSMGDFQDLKLRVQVDLSRRTWIVYRYHQPLFAGQKPACTVPIPPNPNQQSSSPLSSSLPLAAAAPPPQEQHFLYKTACITVSWSRYIAIAARYGPPPENHFTNKFLYVESDEEEEEDTETEGDEEKQVSPQKQSSKDGTTLVKEEEGISNDKKDQDDSSSSNLEDSFLVRAAEIGVRRRMTEGDDIAATGTAVTVAGEPPLQDQNAVVAGASNPRTDTDRTIPGDNNGTIPKSPTRTTPHTTVPLPQPPSKTSELLANAASSLKSACQRPPSCISPNGETSPMTIKLDPSTFTASGVMYDESSQQDGPEESSNVPIGRPTPIKSNKSQRADSEQDEETTPSAKAATPATASAGAATTTGGGGGSRVSDYLLATSQSFTQFFINASSKNASELSLANTNSTHSRQRAPSKKQLRREQRRRQYELALEGVVQLDEAPIIKCQEIYTKIIGNHQTCIVSKEDVITLLQLDREEHQQHEEQLRHEQAEKDRAEEESSSYQQYTNLGGEGEDDKEEDDDDPLVVAATVEEEIQNSPLKKVGTAPENKLSSAAQRFSDWTMTKLPLFINTNSDPKKKDEEASSQLLSSVVQQAAEALATTPTADNTSTTTPPKIDSTAFPALLDETNGKATTTVQLLLSPNKSLLDDTDDDCDEEDASSAEIIIPHDTNKNASNAETPVVSPSDTPDEKDMTAQKKKLSSPSSKGSGGGIAAAAAKEKEEPELVAYWAWKNSLLTHKMQMHLGKNSDLALHVVLAILVNQVRYERNALAMTV
jgi:hypothetical protein